VTVVEVHEVKDKEAIQGFLKHVCANLMHATLILAPLHTNTIVLLIISAWTAKIPEEDSFVYKRYSYCMHCDYITGLSEKVYLAKNVPFCDSM